MNKFPKVIAVTGTNGKSSVVGFIRQILNANGYPACSWGTLGFIDYEGNASEMSLDALNENHIPEALQEKLIMADYEAIACEAHSDALFDGHWDGIEVAAAAFTSFAREHIDTHGNMETYWNAKVHLFKNILPPGSPAVINLSAAYEKELALILENRGVNALLIRNSEKLYFERTAEGLGFTKGDLCLNGEKYNNITLPFFGDIMIQNFLVAIGVVTEMGYQLNDIKNLCASLRLPKGRLEKIATYNNADILIDYAHTPDAIEAVLKNLRRIVKGKIHLVFGCGGETEDFKRSGMSVAAAELSDFVYITDDNPRFENPADIRKVLLSYCPAAIEIPERWQAIVAAIQRLKENDCLIIAGKGHETKSEVMGNWVEHSDHSVVKDFIRKCQATE